ncbi:uncharacterized protein LOC119598746 [Penaeus monodon]|uniref:uncharacterized protein LOC119598746 n=1 Tax=Penaeus monodon TaxID=6687 RepID=UPI0018A72C09|nr:uncharacterized protein LOC119598746 [Penaeus monodon]XP_037804466.1 uncharacterized protein LOC119598746 [Penaeus monodon]
MKKCCTDGDSRRKVVDMKTGKTVVQQSYSEPGIKSEKMESVQGVKSLKSALEERGRSEEFGQCLLCKGAVTSVDGVCIGLDFELPFSGLDLVSLLQCYSVSLSLQDSLQLHKRTDLCKECYELVMKGDSAYSHVYSVASKMSRLWSGRMSECVTFSLNVNNSKKLTYHCIYCDEKFEDESKWHFHMKINHKMNVNFQEIKISSDGEQEKSESLRTSVCKSDNSFTCTARCQSFKDQGTFLTHKNERDTSSIVSESEAVCKSGVNSPLDISNKVGSNIHQQNALNLKTDSKSQERNMLEYPPSLRHIFWAKHELMLQDKEDELILSYLQGNVNIGSNVHGDNEQAGENENELSDNILRKNATNKKVHMQVIPKNKEKGEGSRQSEEGDFRSGVTINLKSRERVRTSRKLLTYRFSKKKSETVIQEEDHKRNFKRVHGQYTYNKQPKKITKTLVQQYPINSKGKKLDGYEIQQSNYHRKQKYPETRDLYRVTASPQIKEENDQLLPQDEETRSACGDDGMTETDILGDDVETNVNVPEEGGCAVVDIYNGPVNLCDVSDDFRCIIING